MQIEDGDFGATVDANERAYHANATVRVLDHATDLIMPTGIPAPKGRQQQRPNQWRDYLSPMRMPRELKREATGSSALVGEVRLMG
jgi:hypothetical protein